MVGPLRRMKFIDWRKAGIIGASTFTTSYLWTSSIVAAAQVTSLMLLGEVFGDVTNRKWKGFVRSRGYEGEITKEYLPIDWRGAGVNSFVTMGILASTALSPDTSLQEAFHPLYVAPLTYLSLRASPSTGIFLGKSGISATKNSLSEFLPSLREAGKKKHLFVSASHLELSHTDPGRFVDYLTQPKLAQTIQLKEPVQRTIMMMAEEYGPLIAYLDARLRTLKEAPALADHHFQQARREVKDLDDLVNLVLIAKRDNRPEASELAKRFIQEVQASDLSYHREIAKDTRKWTLHFHKNRSQKVAMVERFGISPRHYALEEYISERLKENWDFFAPINLHYENGVFTQLYHDIPTLRSQFASFTPAERAAYRCQDIVNWKVLTGIYEDFGIEGVVDLHEKHLGQPLIDTPVFRRAVLHAIDKHEEERQLHSVPRTDFHADNKLYDRQEKRTVSTDHEIKERDHALTEMINMYFYHAAESLDSGKDELLSFLEQFLDAADLPHKEFPQRMEDMVDFYFLRNISFLQAWSSPGKDFYLERGPLLIASQNFYKDMEDVTGADFSLYKNATTAMQQWLKQYT